MSEVDRHAADTVGVSFSEDLAYCLYARDAWGIATPTASQIPLCSPEVASTRSRAGIPSAQTEDLGPGWESWWRAGVGECVDRVVPADRPERQLPDDLASPDVQQAFRALYPEAREWMTQRKAEHIQLMRLTRTPRMRTAVLGLRPGDLFIVCIPVESSFGQLISPNHVLVSPALYGDQPGFLDWLGTTLTAS